ncbi:MAG: helix-turn-helix domain-containing protein [Eubacteriales bacterium]|nr:helix-turn-helix domain-containing protein [Eubacteriales bacterium]
MLSENIRTLRKAKGLSQEELAVRLNVVRQTVSKWEKGLSVPDAGMLIALAEALETTVNILLDEAPPQVETPENTAQLAAKLELLNRRFYEMAERRRRLWRGASLALGVLGLIQLAQWLLRLYHRASVQADMAANEAIIGGADGPTAIIVSRASPEEWGAILGAVALVAAAVVFYRTRRRI